MRTGSPSRPDRLLSDETGPVRIGAAGSLGRHGRASGPDPRRGGVAVRLRLPPPGTPRRCLPPGRRLRPVSTVGRQPGADGQRLRHPRHPHHGAGGRRGGHTGRDRRPLPRRVPGCLGAPGDLLGLLHVDRHREPCGRDARRLPATAREGLHRPADQRPVLRRRGGALPARPVHRGHLPALRLRRGAGRPVRGLRSHPRSRGTRRPPLEDHGCRARGAFHRALLPAALRLRGVARLMAGRPRGLAPPRPQLLEGLDRRGPPGPCHHPRPRVGRGRAGRRPRRRQAHLRLVRGGHRLSLRRQGVGAATGRPRGVA